MSIKWAIGAVVAVSAAMFILPSVVSAHNAELSGSNSGCKDAGEGFRITWTLTAEAPSYRELDRFEGYDEETDSTGNVLDVVDGSVAPSLSTDDFINTGEGDDNADREGDTLSPPDGGILGNGSATAQTIYGPDDEPNDVIYAEGTVIWTDDDGPREKFSDWVRSNDVSAPGYCTELTCTDDGSETMTADKAAEAIENGTATAGNCDPNEPITPVVLVVEPEPEVVEPEAEVESAVVEIAAALPAAGYGDSAGAGFAWTALAAVALLSIGGSVAVVARRK
jgi:hypothetical protein